MLRVSNIRQFVKRAENLEQIVCFGAGKRMETLIEIFSNTGVLGKVSYIIDNNQKKQHSQITVGEKKVEIISLNELKQLSCNNFAIVITCIDYSSIVKQLDTDEMFQGVDYYCLYHMLLLKQEEEETKKAFARKIPADLKISKEQQIPKAIHYCWFGRNPVPNKYKRWMESWRKYCPDYDIVEWNEDNYDITKNVYMYEAYKHKKWGFVPDYARLDIIYHYGGIYLDTDVELVQNLDDLLYQKGFVGFEDDRYVNLGLGFGAVKGLPILKDMMDFYESQKFVNENGSLNLTASPHYQTQILEEHGLCANGEYQKVGEFTVYPEKVLSGKNWTTRRVILHPYTRSIHHFDSSWVEGESKGKTAQLEKDMRLYQPDELPENL